MMCKVLRQEWPQRNIRCTDVTSHFEEDYGNRFGFNVSVAQFIHPLTKKISKCPRSIGPIVTSIKEKKTSNIRGKIKIGVFEASKKITRFIAAERPRITMMNIRINETIAGVKQVGNAMGQHVESPLAVCGEEF